MENNEKGVAASRQTKLNVASLTELVDRNLTLAKSGCDRTLTQLFWFDCVQLLNSIEPNRSIEFD